MTEEQRAAMQAAHDALEIAQNNLAASRDCLRLDDRDLWDQYQSAMDGITSALAGPDLDPSCDDKRLAEIIMSDCGHSSDHTRLLERITNRIATHVATQTADALAEKHAQEYVPFLDGSEILEIATSLDHTDGIGFARKIEQAVRKKAGLQ